MSCVHEGGGRDWARMPNGIIKPHPYCCSCGTMKNVSSDRGKKLSHFMIALSRLRKTLQKKGHKVSDAQIRLIMKDLSEMDGFGDTWWIPYSKQKEIFISVVRKYIKVSRSVVESVL